MKIEIRSNSVKISGYVNAVERDSRILPKSMSPSANSNFVERIKAKTFRKALETTKDVEARYNHDNLLGGLKNGNLKLFEDNIGLYAELETNDTNVIEKAKSDELRGWSFGFISKHDEWEDIKEGLQRRNLDEIELREVSILSVTPAYIGTSIEMRDKNCEILETRGQHEQPETTVIEDDKPLNLNANKHFELEILKMRG